MKEIVEMLAPMLEHRLGLFKPELAQWVQYIGCETTDDSDRVTFKFRTSRYAVDFELEMLVVGGMATMRKINYTELFGLFRDVKYKFLNGKL